MTLRPLSQFDNGPLASKNCGTTCTAMEIDLESGGTKKPSGSDVRAFVRNPNGTPDITGGTRPSQNVEAAKRGYDVTLDLRNMPFEEAWQTGESNRFGVSLSMSYAPVAGTAFDACPGFTGFHQVLLHGGKVYDPLADHRRPSIPQAPQVWPKELLREACARYAGPGRAVAIIAEAPKITVPRYSVAFAPGSFWVWRIAGGVLQPHQPEDARRFAKKTSAPCDAPRTWPLLNGKRRRLVRINKGILTGAWVEPGASHVKLLVKT